MGTENLQRLEQSGEELIILDCTIRDGSYAVDFKFTELDTALLTEQLASVGLKWIEVGHGLGLGAMEAGRGNMPASDVELIGAAKSRCGKAKIGAFFIPSIGKRIQLERAREAGLDFVRIGEDASEVEGVFPDITHARKLGLIPCLNMMKTYALTPERFAELAKGAFEAGAEVVYCADSAGSMMPQDVARYFDAARGATDGSLGFHGHNNLMMAVANCVTAYEHGVRYLDATLTGFGRSAGNAPTEILAAVFERLHVATGIDLFRAMDVVEKYMWPLVGRTRPNDMMAVVAGYARFHTSFLPRVEASAAAHGVDPRRLVASVGAHDPVNLDLAYMDQAARALAAAGPALDASASDVLLGPPPARTDSARALIESLSVSSAKRAGSVAALLLMPGTNGDHAGVSAEYVLADSHLVLGRITYGSIEALREVLGIARSDIAFFLVCLEEGWPEVALDEVEAVVGRERAIPVRDRELRDVFVREAVDRVVQADSVDRTRVLVYGKGPAASLVQNRAFDVILCTTTPSKEEHGVLQSGLSDRGRLIVLNLNLAYAGVFDRHLAIERALEASAHALA